METESSVSCGMRPVPESKQKEKSTQSTRQRSVYRGIRWQVQIDDVGQNRGVETARRQFSGHNEAEAARIELRHDLRSHRDTKKSRR
jgi:hypothetical protein